MSGRLGDSGRSSGRPAGVPPDMPFAFETRFDELKLTAPTYVESQELHRWCQANRIKCCAPEWLLKTWCISVNSDVP